MNTRFGSIERGPLPYAPESTSDYRWERLPAEAAYADMALADTRAASGPDPYAAHPSRLYRFLFVASAATVAIVYLGPVVPARYAWAAAAILACVVPLYALFQGEILSRRAFLVALVRWPLVLVVPTVAAPLLGHRLAAAAILALLAVLALCVAAKDLFAFSDAWLHCHYRLSRPGPDALAATSWQPDWLYVSVLFALASFGPAFSPFAALLSCVALTVFVLRRRVRRARQTDPAFSARGLAAFAARTASFPRSYLSNFRAYPGCWNPRRPDAPSRFGDRLRFWSARDHGRVPFTGLLALLLVSVQLTVALSAYFPWDLPVFRGAFLRTFREDIHPSPWHMRVVQQAAPATDWTRFPKPPNPPADALTAAEVEDALAGLTPAEQLELLRAYRQQRAEERRHAARVDRAAAEALNASPYLWVYVALWGLLRGEILFAYPWLFVLVGIALAPALFLFTAFFRPFLALERTRARYAAEAAAAAKADPDASTAWARYTQVLSRSPHTAQDPVDPSRTVREADHLFMGHEPHLRFPVLLDKGVLSQHAYILGGTGFGKTSLGVMPLVVRLLRGQLEPARGDNPARIGAMPPMLIIDLKGDMALFQTVKHEVERKAKEEGRSLRDAFRVFSCERGHACHAFNPFSNLDSERRATVELCNVYLDALNLNHGEGYGRSYYTMRSRSLLHLVLNPKSDAPNRPRSFRDLHEALQRRSRSAAFREAFELVATVEALMDYDRIAAPPDDPDEPVLHMPDVVRNRQVAYFWLPAAEHSLTAKEIASLALYTFYTALREWVKSNEWQALGLPRPQGYLVIDEFQRVASRNFPNILREARSFGLGVVLAHQSASDLELPDLDLASIVRENTRLKLFFAIQDPHERDLFSKMSGTEFALQPSVSFGYRDVVDTPRDGRRASRLRRVQQMSESFTPIQKPRITANDIIETSDYPFDYYMLVGQGAGYTQFGGYPIPVRTSWPMDTGTYRARSEDPWPDNATLGLPEGVPPNAKDPREIDARLQAALEAARAYVDERTRKLIDDDPSLFR